MIKWLKYSGATLAITFNPYHWGFEFKFRKSADVWEQDHFSIKLLFLSFRFWLDNGDW